MNVERRRARCGRIEENCPCPPGALAAVGCGVAPKSRYHCAAPLGGIELPDDTLTGTAT
jgi:hypothetical protein